MARFRLIWGLFALAATFVAFLVLLILQHRPEAESRDSPPSIERVVAAEVAARYAVPDAPPVVTRVRDIAVLSVSNPYFYADLRDGDWLVRYPKLLIAYRREEGRIVKIETLAE